MSTNVSVEATKLLGKSRFREAAQLISDAIAKHGESAELWNDWAVIQYGMGELEDAEKALRRALRLDPDSAGAAENLGALLFAQSRKAEAAPWLTQAMQAASGEKRDVLERLIAQCNSTQGEPEKAAGEAGPGPDACSENLAKKAGT